MIEKHLYQRTIVKKGKKIKVWYFWFSHNGKQIRRSCGTNGPCLTKRDAQQYIANIKDEDLIPSYSQISFNDYCKDFFAENSLYVKRQICKGFNWTKSTLKHKQHYLSVFLEKFGNKSPTEVTARDIDNWLISCDRGNSWRNNIIETMQTVYKEMYKDNVITAVPLLEKYKLKKTSTKGILFPEEIQTLFPDNYNDVIKIWNKNNTDPEYYSYMFATILYLILSTGMRSGEATALQPSQFIQDNVILINAMFSDGERVDHLKKGTEENKKWRIAIVSKKALRMLETLQQIQNEYKMTDYIFEYHGKAISGNYLNKRFKYVLNKIGIDTDSRNLSVHSLRFTYNTMMKKEISTNDLRLMLGHTSERMTDYYDRSQITEHLPILMNNQKIIDSIW